VARTPIPPAVRFWRKVDKAGPVPAHRLDLGPCWLWTGARTKQYGNFQAGTRQTDPKVYAHIFAWAEEHGPVPDGLELDHLCVRPLCVRPSHCEAVTHAVNRARSRLTRCRADLHDITDATARWDKNGNRRGCLACWQDAQRRRPPRRKVK
jgi:hypothetical protein